MTTEDAGRIRQLPSGRWVATRRTSGATEVRIVNTEAEAQEWADE